MSNIVPLSNHTAKKPSQVSFDRRELGLILNVYGQMVSKGIHSIASRKSLRYVTSRGNSQLLHRVGLFWNVVMIWHWFYVCLTNNVFGLF